MSAASHEYPAIASHPDSNDAEWTGLVRVQPPALVFVADEVQATIPLNRVVLAREDNGGITLTDLEQPGWSFKTATAEILQHYVFQTHNRLRLQVRELRRSHEGTRNLRLAVGFIIVIVLAVALLWGLTGLTIRFLVASVPVAWEAELSQNAWTEMREHITVVERPEWPESFHLSTNRLMSHLPRNPYRFEFLLISNPVPNAVALPAGRILVHSGLFQFADQPEQIAGVLAHEMAHVTRRHGLRQLIATAGPYYVLRLFISDRRGFGALVRNGSLLLMRQDYSREHEREADALAWRHLVAAQIDPRGLTSFFEKLASNPLERWMNAGGLRMLRSHPPTPERIENLRRLERSQRQSFEFVPLTNATAP